MMTDAELRALQDPEFRKLFDTDPELNRLEGLQYDEAAEFLLLSCVLHYNLRIGEIPVHPLTAARWSLLWMLGNAYARNSAVKAADMDMFLYILSHDLRKLDCTPHEIPGAASGYLKASGLAPADVHTGIRQMIRTAFMPLEMLPAESEPDEPARFDAGWVVRVASLAARESGCSIEYCKFTMSLSEVCILFVDHCRRNASAEYAARIGRRPDDETGAKILQRTRELQQQYLNQKKQEVSDAGSPDHNL